MQTLGQALVDLRRQAGLSQEDVARIVERSQPVVSLREAGRSQIPASDLAKLAAASGLTIVATPHGWGVVRAAGGADDLTARLKAFGSTEDPSMPEITLQIKAGLPVHPRRDHALDPDEDAPFSLPLLGRAAAGPGSWNDEAELETVSVASRWLTRLDGAILVHGDSMEPLLRDGDLVGVRLHEDYEVGDVVVAVAGAGECIIKVFGGLVNGLVVLNSANLAHPPVVGAPDQLDIQGVAYGLLRAERLRVRQ